ncbi:MAG: PA2778 family cysteine peptidase [Gammaproteobacteria bacterium]|nr:PA2778 family cysteine peptidase [Gammaproteobacteria bacterium]
MFRQGPPGSLRAVFLASTVLILAACAPLQSDRLLKSPQAFPPPVELTGTPFFPQEDFQCGPAALATALNWAGAKVTPEELVPQVYLPERHGSLQTELLAATRRHGRVPYVIEPRMETLLAEVEAGHPVLVLQNLGLSWFTRWHYAVVIGFDLARNEIILRSGRNERHVMSLQSFERTWQRGNHWAMLALPPNRLPASAEETPYLQAVTGLERAQHWQEAKIAYEAALSRWPDSVPARMGVGNSLYAMKDLPGAERAYRYITLSTPSFAPAFNNLAQVLAEQGQLKPAEQAARRAVSLGGPLEATYQETLQQVLDKLAAPAKR